MKYLSYFLLFLVFSSPVYASTQTDQIILRFKKSSDIVNLRSDSWLSDKLASLRISQQSKKFLSDYSARQYSRELQVLKFQRTLSEQELNNLLYVLQQDNTIEFVMPDYIGEAFWTPNDPHYSKQWYAHWYEGISIHATQAWDNVRGNNKIIAVVDTGVYPYHEDLNGKVLPGYDFISDTRNSNDGDGWDSNADDPGDWTEEDETPCHNSAVGQLKKSSWHGLHVAGLAAAHTNNRKGIAGVAPGAKILPVRVLGRCGDYMSDLIEAVYWTAGYHVSGAPSHRYKVDVMNFSLGFRDLQPSCPQPLQEAFDYAYSRNVVAVAAAGNYDINASRIAPAACNHVIAVGATNRDGYKAEYSDYGSTVDLAAPGGTHPGLNPDPTTRLYSSFNSGLRWPEHYGYEYNAGTSMATPLVSGAVALLRALQPSSSVSEIEHILKVSTQPFKHSIPTGKPIGTGLLDVNAATDLVRSDAELKKGTAASATRTNLSGDKGSRRFFYYKLKGDENTIRFTIEPESGSSGDADLYVRKGHVPASKSGYYGCKSVNTGNNDSCAISNSGSGIVYVMIEGYEDFSHVKLKFITTD